MCPHAACPGACAAGYPVSVEVLYVTAGEHYGINANSPPADGFRDAGGGNMNSPAHDPLPRNCDKIAGEAALALGSRAACTSQAR